LENNPAIIHGGPFANIAQGTNTVVATKMGLSLTDYVVTEAGFGADLGAEKFLDIKCAYSGLSPKTIVLVATVRALKYHGGQKREELSTPNLDALKKGSLNLEKHLENMNHYGVPAVVAINKFVSDSTEELEFIKQLCKNKNVRVAECRGWESGGDGATDLAKLVIDNMEDCKKDFTPVYDWNLSVEEKIETVAKKIYGAGSISYLEKAKLDLIKVKRLGLEKLPVCIAKTQNSLSDDTKLLGRPEGFKITVREIEIASGAGFLIPITGKMLRMPGLPSKPAAENIDIDKNGNVIGLS
jgi:formate--tetrahydrofolate ligase